FSFEVVQISLGRLLFKIAPNDFLRIILFSAGYFAVNILLTFIYIKVLAKTKLKQYVLAVFFVLILGLYSSVLVSLPYVFPEITLSNLTVFIFIYVGFFIHLYITANAIVWRQELDLEKDQLSREISNLMKLPEVLDEQTDNLDELIEKVLNISCEIIGFEYALLNIFDFRTGKVVRLSKSGISEEDFKNLREKNVSIRETYALFQQRFDVGGAYFIPKGSITLDSDSIYYPTKYASLDSDNAWNPDDLFLVPLLYGGKIIGYLSYDKPKNLLRPTIREVQFAKFFAWHLTKILLQSYYATLFTGQVKQQQNYSNVMNEISKAIESKRNFILVYLDIDHFEKINMTLGFEKGDEILKNLSDITADELKNLGVFSTVTDEEIILMWSKSKSDGVLLAERIREEIKKKYPIVEISACVVKYPSDAENFDELIEKARTGLVTVKKSGGGRVISL
ncbi:MAG: sensor domain-containing diguanylate cyclase, partial [Fervidobacterium sp.]